MARHRLFAAACVLLIGACAVHLTDPAARRCDETHGCAPAQVCDLSQDLCVTSLTGPDGGRLDTDGGSLAVVPAHAVLSPGSQQAFAIVGSPANTSFEVKEANGGTIDDSGLYTAPQTAGTYHVVAGTADGKITGSADIVVAGYPAVTDGLVSHWSADNVNGQGQPLPADGAPVTLWKDLVGANDLQTSGINTEPVFKWQGVAGNPTVTFDGVAQYLQSAVISPALAQPNTLLIVFKTPPTPISPVAATVFDAPAGTTDRTRLVVTYGPPAGALQMYALKFAASPYGHGPGKFVLASFEFHGGNSLQRVNRITELQLNNNAANGPGDAGVGGILLGGRQDLSPNQFADTEIAELFLYNRALTLNELTSIEDVLAAKYDLP